MKIAQITDKEGCFKVVTTSAYVPVEFHYMEYDTLVEFAASKPLFEQQYEVTKVVPIDHTK